METPVSREALRNCMYQRERYAQNREAKLALMKARRDAKREADLHAGIPRPGRGRPKKYQEDLPLPPKKKPGRPRKVFPQDPPAEKSS